MIYTNSSSTFPSQVVPDAEKKTYGYGLAVAKAVEDEWFRGDRGTGTGGRFGTNWARFNDCLLYTSPSPRDGLLSRMPSSA